MHLLFQVTKIFIDGLPPSWDENRVREHLQKFGKIEKVELAKNMLTAKRKDFGYVTFYSHDDAVTCAESINNTLLGDGEEKVCCHCDYWLLHIELIMMQFFSFYYLILTHIEDSGDPPTVNPTPSSHNCFI